MIHYVMVFIDEEGAWYSFPTTDFDDVKKQVHLSLQTGIPATYYRMQHQDPSPKEGQ